MSKNRSKSKAKPKTKAVAQRRGDPSLFVHKGPYLMPSRYRIALKYSTKVIMTDASSADANIRYRPSSIYDVDPNVGGGSYYGFAEVAAFYHKYRVHSSKITVLVVNRDAEGHVPYVLPIPTDPGANVSDPSRYYMNNLARKKVVGNYAGNATAKLTCYSTTKAISGVQEFAEDTYSADVGANPVDNWFWFIGTRFLGSGSMTYGLSLDIEIETVVDFFDRKVLTDPSYLATPQGVAKQAGAPYPPPQPVYMVNPPVER